MIRPRNVKRPAQVFRVNWGGEWTLTLVFRFGSRARSTALLSLLPTSHGFTFAKCFCFSYNHHNSLRGHGLIAIAGVPTISKFRGLKEQSLPTAAPASAAPGKAGEAELLILAGFLQASRGSWTALSWARRGRAGRGQLPWGSSAPHVSHVPPGTSGLAQAGSSHANSRDAGEQAQPHKHAFKPLLVPHLLASYWPKQVPWAESVGQRTYSSLDGKSCRGTWERIAIE